MNEQNNSQKSTKTVIFLHVPKAAGTTLCDIFLRQYKAKTIHLLDGANFDQTQEDFKRLPLAEKAPIKVLMGHMYFGLHEYLPTPATYVTMLRNPIDRIVSYYHFVERLPSHPDYELIKAKNITIEDYCQMGIVNMCNGQTRFLANTQLSETYNRETLERAKSHLEQHFSVVGIQ